MSMLRRLAAGLLIAGVLLPVRLPAQAQATTGVVRGVVRDTSGNRLQGATVTLRQLETNQSRTVTTNQQGAFVASLLRVGRYDLSVRALGFDEARRQGLDVRLGETVDLQLTLRPQAIALEGITVSAAPLVDATAAQAATRMDEQVVSNLPNNGRNFVNLTLLTPNVSVVQGPDGDEISIGGQRGIHNNYSVDGADFGNPFFGEQRGGQRPAFTFNLDAVQEFVVVSNGASAEFGRSGGGFVNVLTRSGTNEVRGTAHAYGKSDALSSDYARGGGNPDFSQGQFGFTLGGPLRRDRVFFFMALDHQQFEQTKQIDAGRIGDPRLRAFMDTAFGGVLANDYGPIRRTNDATAFLTKFDYRVSDAHQATLKYNYTHSRQENGTFDVDAWARSSNGVERDFSHAVNGSLTSLLSNALSNEFRFQLSREDRPRDYTGPDVPGTGHPFPDTGMDFVEGYRFGLPFFLPIQAHDTRIQLLDNVSLVRGDHFFKAGAEWNRTEATQTFVGFGSGRFIFNDVNGFLNYVRFGPGYVECSNGTTSLTAACPAGSSITGPVNLYLQQVGVDGRTVEEAGTQSIPQHEVALFVQDTWKPSSRLTLNYGLRWEAQVQPDPITPPDEVFFAPFIGTTVSNAKGSFEFPSDGRIPSDYGMFQPRLGVAWDVRGDNREVVRASAGVYYARVPGLVLASTRSTNGSIGQTLFRNSALTGILGPPPVYGQLLPAPAGVPFAPGVFVFDKDFRNPRTLTFSAGYEREIATGYSVGLSYQHSQTDFLTRFVDRNDPVFGSPWSAGLEPGGANGIGTLTVVESSARSRYHGVTLEVKGAPSRDLQFQANYTLSGDRSDDDNERDPFSFRYARADRLDAEYGWSDRDQRHRFNGFMLARIPGSVVMSHRISFASAQPMSEKCGAGNTGTGERAASPGERICANGSILPRNTLRKDNEFFSWDVRLSRAFGVGGHRAVEVILDVFNLTNSDNFRDPAATSLLFNFDGTVRGGLGDPRQAQLGLRVVF